MNEPVSVSIQPHHKPLIIAQRYGDQHLNHADIHEARSHIFLSDQDTAVSIS
jgi:hypothetical protein